MVKRKSIRTWEMQTWGISLQLRKPLTAGCWEGGVTKWSLYISRILYSFLYQAPASGRPWRWDPQGDNSLVWPAVDISGSHYNSWQHQPDVSAFPSKWGELSLQSIPMPWLLGLSLGGNYPRADTWRRPVGQFLQLQNTERRDGVWWEEAAHSPSSAGATTTRTVQKCSYCSPTMKNIILTTASLVTTAQRGLTCSRAPTQACCTGTEPPRAPCPDMELKMACSA